MRRVIALFAALITFANISAAQDGYANTCDPTHQFECTGLALKYLSAPYGTPRFPNDPKRADALIRMGLDGAHAGCAGADYSQCYSLSDLLIRPSDAPAPGPYSDAGRMKAYIENTEARCYAGEAEACYWRSVAFPHYKPELMDVGVAIEVAKGLSKSDALAAVQSQSRTFKRRILPTAIAQLPTLQNNCAQNVPNTCAKLGELLSDHEVLRSAPFEHIAILFDACDDSTPRACSSLKNAISTLAIIKPKQAVETPIRTKWVAAVKQECSAGRIEFCEILVDLARSNNELDRDTQLMIACDTGSAKNCRKIAQTRLREYDENQVPSDLQAAVDLLTTACASNDNMACHMLEHLSKG